MKNSKFGRKAEEAVAKALRTQGAEVDLYPGSRGPGGTDFKACWPTGTCWYGQVKATRVSSCGGPAWPAPKEIGRLKQRATKNGGTAVVVQVEGTTVVYRSAKDGGVLRPPVSRKS
jgi:hypothetical protein